MKIITSTSSIYYNVTYKIKTIFFFYPKLRSSLRVLPTEIISCAQYTHITHHHLYANLNHQLFLFVYLYIIYIFIYIYNDLGNNRIGGFFMTP